jgi:DNA polymerase III subunit alpha
MGLGVLGPDVNESREMFTPVGGKIRFGLAGIKGVGELAAQRIIAEREANGPFADFVDFATRVDGRAVNKRVLEHLVKTGAFDFSGSGRRSLFEGIDAAIAASSAQARDRAAGQDNFLGSARRAGRGPGRRARRKRGPAPDFSSHERLSFEKELLGFYVSGHPMNSYSGLWEAIDTAPADELPGLPDRGRSSACAGSRQHRQEVREEGQPALGRFHAGHPGATIALNMFADAFASYGSVLAENAPVLVQGNIIGAPTGPGQREGMLPARRRGVPDRAQGDVAPKAGPSRPRIVPAGPARGRRAGPGRHADRIRVLLADGIAPVAEASAALSWRLTGAVFQELRSHPSVAGIRIETRPLELKPETRWARR